MASVLLVCLLALLAPLRVAAQCTPLGVAVEFVAPSDSGHVLVTDDSEVAKNTALCHVECLNQILNGDGMPNGTNGTNSTDAKRSADSTMNEGIIALDCFSEYKDYLDCRYGCVLQSQGESECSSTCSSRCESMCDGYASCFSDDVYECGVDCNEEECSDGCELYDILSAQSEDLVAPLSGPDLVQCNGTHSYDVIIPEELRVLGISSLVFRTEDQSSPGDYVYQWMVDVEYGILVSLNPPVVDLAAYSCRTVNVSYAFATTMGLSEYSTATVIDVPGNLTATVIDAPASQLNCSVSGSSSYVVIDCPSISSATILLCSFDVGPLHPCTLPLSITIEVSPPGNHSLRIATNNGTAAITYVISSNPISHMQHHVPPLDVYLMNDSPNVFNDSVQAEFQTTRPVAGVRCILRSRHDRKWQICSSGHVSFSGLQSGLYVLKVHAFNRRDDVSTIKRGFVISSDPYYCSLVLINRGVVLSQNSSIATVEVKVQGPALQLSCVLDGGEEFSCSSPIVLSGLAQGRHQLEVTPLGCDGGSKTLLVSFAT